MNHSVAAEKFIQDTPRVNWHDKAVWYIREKRDRAVAFVPEWEELRDAAAAIKGETISKLDEYLVQFESRAKENGIIIHWAVDGEAHNKIVHQILDKHQVQLAVKSKSMLTEECGLNSYLEGQGIEVVDTDLGERVIQLAKEDPSHIVMPAIHRKKEEIGELFHAHLGTDPGNNDPNYLTEAARHHLRKKFLKADAAITGVNFAIAGTGGFVVVTNEGNADMGVNLTPLHIASMGIEKIIPKPEHLGVFLRLLARSATGQPITTYTSHFHKPREGSELHVVIVDNGRSRQLGQKDFRRSLHCIRCGACMNTCPVYRRSGGHSYGYSIPGPIGSILSPNMDPEKHASLPFASTLCGSCSTVCPVKIDIDKQLYKWRQIITDKGFAPTKKTMSIKLGNYSFSNPMIFRVIGGLARMGMKLLPKSLTNLLLIKWTKDRDLPKIPKRSFRDWFLKRERAK